MHIDLHVTALSGFGFVFYFVCLGVGLRRMAECEFFISILHAKQWDHLVNIFNVSMRTKLTMPD